METLIIGGGGREQALAEKLSQSPEIETIYIAPGNGGTYDIPKAENVDISPLGVERLVRFAVQNKIDLTVVGPDDPLAIGIVDEFESNGLAIFGPTKEQARIEWDRKYAKKIIAPMGEYAHFDNPDDILRYSSDRVRKWPLFVKDNSLAQGKGATSCQNIADVEALVRKMNDEGHFGQGGTVIVEDFVDGPECSHHAFCDGKTHLSIPFVVRDHKTLYEGDTGPMTGGMGTVGPLRMYIPEDVERLGDTFVRPVIEATGFKGMLFTGLKGTVGNERSLEWNARFGDPETQIFMKLLKSDLLPLMIACVDGSLENVTKPEWDLDKYVVCLVMAAPGYPIDVKKGGVVEGIDVAREIEGIDILHAGTYRRGNEVTINGGRVINVVSHGKDLASVIVNAYRAAECITSNPSLQIRSDIGKTVLRGM